MKKTKNLIKTDTRHKALDPNVEIIKPNQNRRIITPEFEKEYSQKWANFGEWFSGNGGTLKTIIMLGMAMVAGMLLMVIIDILD